MVEQQAATFVADEDRAGQEGDDCQQSPLSTLCDYRPVKDVPTFTNHGNTVQVLSQSPSSVPCSSLPTYFISNIFNFKLFCSLIMIGHS